MNGFDWMGAAFVAAVVLWWLFGEGWDARRVRRNEREREKGPPVPPPGREYD